MPIALKPCAAMESARSLAYRAVNTAMVHAYWQVGRLIIEHEQGSRKRAAYGLAVLDDLSRRLTADFGKGFTTTNLRYMRSFYQAFSIHHALRDESRSANNVNAPRSELPEPLNGTQRVPKSRFVTQLVRNPRCLRRASP